MIRMFDIGKLWLAFLAVLVVACSDTSLSEDTEDREDIGVVAAAEELPPCTAEIDGEPFFVKSEKIIRVCSDTKWYAVKDEESGKSDSSGCYVSEKTADSLWVVCGSYSFSVPTSGANNGGSVVLDSEKIATSLEGVSGFTQKGPFLMGSEVNVIELRDGRTLDQTGDNFEAKIQSDDGLFKLNARMMMSQYLELHAKGYYRNEVSGKNSNAQLTLYALTDVMMRSGGVVNINLLTHLEYHRVVYLVKEKKMKVAAAKDTAEREIFSLLHIDSKDFFSSEDLNIVGSSEGDAALLAFSVMFQGDRDVSQLSELLTNVSTDMEKDGKWDNAKMRDTIADWAENADATGRLDTIRANVEGWGLSEMVPNFEKYVRSFWTKEYGLETCGKENLGKVVASGIKRLEKSTNRYICVDSAKIGYMWRRATDFEKDTYGWAAGKDGDMNYGTVNKTTRYIYDARIPAWRVPTDFELLYGGCTDAIAANNSRNVVYSRDVGSVGYGYDTIWVYTARVCMNHEWRDTSLLYIDTRNFGAAEDATVRKGTYSDTTYVYDATSGAWRFGSQAEKDIGLGCTPRLRDTVAYNSYTTWWYSCIKQGRVEVLCDKGYDSSCQEGTWSYASWAQSVLPGCKNDDHGRIPVGEEEGYRCVYGYVWESYNNGDGPEADTYDEVCTEAKIGNMRPGLVRIQSLFVCDNYAWREASPVEERLNLSCTQKNQGDIVGDTLVCDSSKWRNTNFFDYPAGHFLETDGRYGTLHDSRDGKDYKTIIIGNQEWMAENLNFDDGSAYLKDKTRCYNDKPANCEKGGRYYMWTAAMNIDLKWKDDLAREAGKVDSVHQGVCPNGWHIPNTNEWTELFNFVLDPLKMMARNVPEWKSYSQITNESGFTAYPLGISNFVKWWSADEYVYNQAYSAMLPGYTNNYSSGNGSESKVSSFPVRCIKDSPAGN